jgi:steroid delta-isomerase-like uncharacterized protein
MTDTQTSSPVQLAEALIASFSAGDWAKLRAIVTDNVVYQEMGTQRRAEGVEAYLQLAQGWKDAFPDGKGTIRNVVSDGNTVVQEVTWTGTQTQPLPIPGGTLPATGKAISAEASLWYTIQGGRIQEIRHHLDMLTLLQQLGVLPAAG